MHSEMPALTIDPDDLEPIRKFRPSAQARARCGWDKAPEPKVAELESSVQEEYQGIFLLKATKTHGVTQPRDGRLGF